MIFFESPKKCRNKWDAIKNYFALWAQLIRNMRLVMDEIITR